jgi:hypothetical protein
LWLTGRMRAGCYRAAVDSFLVLIIWLFVLPDTLQRDVQDAQILPIRLHLETAPP